MSNVSHVSTVDRGLKMKIKRTKVGPASAKNDAKGDPSASSTGSGGGSNASGTTTHTVPTGGGSGAGVPVVNGVPSVGSTITMDIGKGNSTPTKSGVSTTSSGTAGGSGAFSSDLTKDKYPKVKGSQFVNKKDKNKEKSANKDSPLSSFTTSASSLANGSTGVGGGGGGGNGSGVGGLSSAGSFNAVTSANGLDLYTQGEPRMAVEAVSVKLRDFVKPVLDDPYEFNAKVEDGLCLPPKKLKTDAKVESASSPAHVPTHQDVSTETCSVGINTESEFLGPCEPGTSVYLQGIIWQEQTDSGILVVNVTWREKTYVGTLMDITKNEWAPPRPNCESPVSDFETRTPKGRGKRGRGAAGTPSSERSIAEGRKLRKTRRGSSNNNSNNNSNNGFPTPASPARPDSSSLKRKARSNNDGDTDSVKSDKNAGPSTTKRSRSCSRGGASGSESPTPKGEVVIECPEPNCKKKYKHINGLRYHQTHAHQQLQPNASAGGDEEKEEEEDDMDTDSRDSSSKKNAASENGSSAKDKERDSKKDQQMSERAERAKAKEQRLQRERQREKSLEKDCNSLEDNIPLKAFASRVNAQNVADTVKTGKGSDMSSASSFSSSSTSSSSVVTTISRSVECSTSSVSSGSSSLSSFSSSANLSVMNAPPSALPATTLTSTTVSSKKKDGGASIVNLAVSKTAPGVIGPGGQVIHPVGLGMGMGGLPVMTSSNTVQAPVIAVPAPGSLPSSTSVCAPAPITVAPVGSLDSKGDKSKSTKVTNARPIVPVPTPVAMHSGMGSGMGMGPGSATSQALKMIQPKPTIMGEYNSVNPALADLKAEKQRSKSKKKKDKESGSQSGSLKDGEVGKVDRPSSVIKAVALPRPLDGSIGTPTARKDGIPSIQVSKPADSPRPGSSSVQSPAVHMQVGKDQVRSVQPPGLLKVNSPLHVNPSNEHKTPITDDVQSPAYSDISDANDSSSPQQQESPKKDRESREAKKDESASNAPAGGDVQGVVPPSAYSGMYYYNRPSPFLSPHPNTPHVSPNSNKLQPQKDKEGTSGRTDDHRGNSSVGDTVKNQPESHENKDSASKGPQGNKLDGPGNITPQQQQQQQIFNSQQQYQLECQQKWLQVYSQIRLMPHHAQYQYLAAYGMLDPYVYQVLSQQDPQYRQIFEVMKEQKRIQDQQQQQQLHHHQQQQQLQQSMAGGSNAKRPEAPETPTGRRQQGSRPPSADSRPGSVSESGSSTSKMPSAVYSSQGGPVDRERSFDPKSGDGGEDRDLREQQALREKQNENHQIMKENIELKSHMDRDRQKQEDARRLMFFQQQKHLEQQQQQQRDKRKMEMMGKPPELKSSSSTSGLSSMDSGRLGGLPPGAIKLEDIKKEPVDRVKDPSSRMSESKCGDDKRLEKSRSASSLSDSGKPLLSKPQDLPGIVAGLPVLSSIPSSSGAPPPGQYSPYSPYAILPPHFGVPVDPSHPMYRQMGPHMIGYAAAPPGAYLHPSQIGYRMGPPQLSGDPDKDGVGKGDCKPSGMAQEDVGAGKGDARSQTPQFYSPSMHKIHELAQEKSRATTNQPGSASPAPPKPGEGGGGGERGSGPISALQSSDKQRGSPPTQRHHHTHHHTHVLSHGFYPPEHTPFSVAMYTAPTHGGPAPAQPLPPFNK